MVRFGGQSRPGQMGLFVVICQIDFCAGIDEYRNRYRLYGPMRTADSSASAHDARSDLTGSWSRS